MRANVQKATILVADDEESTRRLVRRVLESNGYRVLEAANGKKALETAGRQKGPIDLLLSDVRMPELDGPGSAQQLQALRPQMRVVFMSGFTDGLLQWDGKRGECPCVQKPFLIAVLLKTLEGALAQAPERLAGGGRVKRAGW